MRKKAESLSEDLIFEILSWLPAMTLIRYTSVCKSWYYTINHSSSFIKKHTTNISRANNRSILVIPDIVIPYAIEDRKPVNCILYSGDTGNIQSKLTLPLIPKSVGDLQVVGSCNGLICLADTCPYDLANYDTCLYIWNPSIRKYKLLPPSHYQYHHKFKTFGFGYHNQSNDYRVVRISYYEDIAQTKVEVYSLNTNSWREVNLVKPIKVTRKASVSANGYIYWLAANTSILSFNIDNDSFEEITHPAVSPGFSLSHGFSLRTYIIGVVGERLCLLIAPYYCSSKRDGEYEIWMMREDGVFKSWTKIYNVKQPNKQISRTYGLSVKGEILLLGGNDDCLSVYDHENLRDFNLYSEGTVHLAETYMESLVLLDMSRDRKSKRIEEAESSNKEMKLSFTENN